MNLKEAKQILEIKVLPRYKTDLAVIAATRVSELEAQLTDVGKVNDDLGVIYVSMIPPMVRQLERQLAAEQAECERLRIQLAACGVAANANTWESAAKMRLNDKSPYWSESYSDVCNAVNREIEHRGAATVLAKEREELREQLAAANRILENRCEHCGAAINAHGCPTCGAPQCCPQCCRIDSLEHRLAAAQELERWVPVTERLPDREGEYLCKLQNVFAVLYYRNGFYYDDSRITHWRELPKFEDKNED